MLWAFLDYITLRRMKVGSISKVYDVFYEMWSNKEECPREIYFSIRGGYHYSKKLEETFFQLGTSRLLEVRNPEYSSVLLSKESKTRIKNYLEGVYLRKILIKSPHYLNNLGNK